MGLRVQRWEKTAPPAENELRERYRQEGLQPYTWSNGPGDTYPAHSHVYHKVIYVVHGSISWILPESGEEFTTSAGDRIDLPAGTLHAARVGPQGVTCLEAHREK
jgi:quercetin dioxygenase-like cupin family protein